MQVEPGSDIASLKKVRYLAYQNIWWDTLRNTSVYQCKNCQRIGHTSSCCNLGYRCVKCAKEHQPGQCALEKNVKRELLECINCKRFGKTSAGHPASYKGCPYIKFAQELKDKEQKTKIRTKVSKYINTDRKYSSELTSARALRVHSDASQSNRKNSHGAPPQPPSKRPWEEHTSPFDLHTQFKVFENHMMSAMTELLSGLGKLIEKNTKNINKLFKTVGINNGY